MDERGLWELFWKTGLPEVWLALSSCRLEEEPQARTAFYADKEKV